MKHTQLVLSLAALTCIYLSLAATITNAAISQITTQINDEINPELRKTIIGIQKKFIEGVKTKDFKKVSSVLSSDLLESKEIDLKSYLNKISPLVSKRNFVLQDQYYSKLNKIGAKTPSTIIPSLSDKSKLIINNLTFFGNESYNLFLKSTHKGWQHLLFLRLKKMNGTWKIHLINMGNYSINGLNAPQLYELGNKAKNDGRLSSAVMYAIALSKSLRPAPFLQYMDESKYQYFIQTSIEDLNNRLKFPLILEDIQIFGINMQTTENQGIIPLVLYITKTNFEKPGWIKDQALKMKDQILEKFHGIEEDFDFILMRAYNEMPSDPKKQYKVYNTVLKLNEPQSPIN